MITLSNLTNVCLFSTKDRKYLSGVMKQENEPDEYTAVHDALYDPSTHSVTILDLNLRKLGKKNKGKYCLIQIESVHLRPIIPQRVRQSVF